MTNMTLHLLSEWYVELGVAWLVGRVNGERWLGGEGGLSAAKLWMDWSTTTTILKCFYVQQYIDFCVCFFMFPFCVYVTSAYFMFGDFTEK